MLHMSVITQNGDSALYWAAYWGRTEVIQQLVKAGANLDLQNKVCQYVETHDVHEYCDNIKSKILGVMMQRIVEKNQGGWTSITCDCNC